MYTILAYILYVFVSLFGYSIPDSGHIDLCQGSEIDGLTYALSIGDNWLVLSDDLYYIDDTCYGPIQIYKISSSGIEPYNG